MSDSEGKPRNDLDPAAQVAADLRARLRGLQPEELIEMAAALVTTYVIEGVLPLARVGEATDLAQDPVGEETFAQMLKRLKAGKRDPLLERFLIDGENISVRIDGMGVLPLTEYRRPNSPPPGRGEQAVAQTRRETVPGASSSIYNRGLYQPDPATVPLAPARTAPAANILAPAPPAQQARPALPGVQQQQAAKKGEEQKDRFSLIELE